jgi:hypothetical protein
LGAAFLHSAYNLLLEVDLWYLALGLDALSLLAAILFLRSLVRQPYGRLNPREHCYLRRTIGRLLDRRQPGPGNPERAPRFHLRHSFLHARLRF